MALQPLTLLVVLLLRYLCVVVDVRSLLLSLSKPLLLSQLLFLCCFFGLKTANVVVVVVVAGVVFVAVVVVVINVTVEIVTRMY